ncbi:MAG: precorrin-3B synthase [Rhodobacteraceae bacterium]|nr:MAG: precorrin-3B synthase [Paracoccaceae bacterium]
MTTPEIKGWCPGAHRPMRSGDGLVVRVRPRGGEIAPEALAGLAALSARHGSGAVDVTARANLQIRGVTDAAYPRLRDRLDALGLLDEDPTAESRRNVTLTPFRTAARDQAGLAEALAQGLADPGFAGLPGKFGFVIDAEPGGRRLAEISGDIRVEGAGETMVVRADGAATGRRAATAADAAALALALARWFLASGGVGPDGRGRMRRHLAAGARPPADLTGDAAPDAPTPPPGPGPAMGGVCVAAAFGQFTADDLALVARVAPAPVRPTPFRTLFLPGLADASALAAAPGIILAAADPMLRVVACPGAPLCPQAAAPTRDLARALAARVRPGALLHVSGCVKGCAHPDAATLTLTARDGAFDLVRDGAPWDAPAARGLSAARVLAELEA